MLNQLHPLLLALTVILNVSAALHALLTKREPASAFAWLLVCLIFPVIGPGIYFLFGINRVRTRAVKLRAGGLNPGQAEAAESWNTHSDYPAVSGNQITPLINGEAAYPAMLAAINNATERLFLSSYIFDTDETGQQFIQALSAAVERGVDVRVMLDGVGQWYSRPRAGQLLRQAQVPTCTFLPPRLLPPSLHVNLRNHRKLLVVDGTKAFTGGINISHRHLLTTGGESAGVADVHFALSGPVVQQMERLFLQDWSFCSQQLKPLQDISPPTTGVTRCRVIPDGPDQTLDAIIMVLIGAISQAQQRILIMTPYFLPPRELLVALKSAALRGIKVDLLLPGKNNIRTVHWACRHMLGELLTAGVQAHYQPSPFVHSKLFVMDDDYLLISSANMDARSLRLNFELAVECFDPALAGQMADHILHSKTRSEPITQAQLEQRPPLIRLRDSLAWLISPYL